MMPLFFMGNGGVMPLPHLTSPHTLSSRVSARKIVIRTMKKEGRSMKIITLVFISIFILSQCGGSINFTGDGDDEELQLENESESSQDTILEPAESSDAQEELDTLCEGSLIDPYNCGECGNACPGGWVCCSGSCHDLQTDYNNCGECGSRCFPGDQCCSGYCTLLIDVKHCGSCDNACADLDGDGCGIPGCWGDGYVCQMVPDNSQCPDGYRCVLPDLIHGQCEQV
jgi:hypothetical protein